MKKERIAKIIFVTFLVLFLALYFTQTSGYYEYEQRRRTEMTEEEIRRFEQDVKDGKEVDASDYLKEDKTYDNKLSSVSLSLSEQIEKALNKGLDYLFQSIDKVVTEK